MYTPTNCKSLADTPQIQQIRLGIQGYPKTGKTWSALTFPNAVVLNLDRGLGAHQGRTDVIEVPFYDLAWVRTWSKDLSYRYEAMKDMLVRWVEQEGSKLTCEQTLVVDGNTGMQNAYHKWYMANQSRFLTKGGTVNDFAEWNVKKQFYGEIMESFKSLKCHVVFLCHEADQKDSNGVWGAKYSGKIRPLLTGAFGDELVSHFSDWFRQHSGDKPKEITAEKELELKRDWYMTKAEFLAWCNTFKDNTIYYWQLQPDNTFDGGASSIVNFPKFAPASFLTLEKYSRKTIST